MPKSIIKQIKLKDDEYRLIEEDNYIYHDEIGGDVKTDPIPTYINTIFSIQLHKKFLWFTWWSYIKSYECKKGNRNYNIQKYNALKYFDKVIKHYESEL